MRQKKEINVRIGANIQSARERAKYTQEELSEMIGVTPNHLSAIERGASGASLETIEKLCQLFGVSADSLLFGTPQPDNFENELIMQLVRIDPQYRPQVQKVMSALLEIFTLQDRDN